MVNIIDVAQRKLTEGKDYIRIDNKQYLVGDRFMQGDLVITIRKIGDRCHFLDGDLNYWHVNMFRDRSCTHCPELNPRPKW